MYIRVQVIDFTVNTRGYYVNVWVHANSSLSTVVMAALTTIPQEQQVDVAVRISLSYGWFNPTFRDFRAEIGHLGCCLRERVCTALRGHDRHNRRGRFTMFQIMVNSNHFRDLFRRRRLERLERERVAREGD